MNRLTTKEKLLNEKKSLNYHLETYKNRLVEDPNNEEAQKQLTKIESYLKGIDKALEEL